VVGAPMIVVGQTYSANFKATTLPKGDQSMIILTPCQYQMAF
jgi:hypothetical protein